MIFFVLPQPAEKRKEKYWSNSQVQFFPTPTLALTVAFHRGGISSAPYIPNCISTKHEYYLKMKHPDLFSGLHIIYTFLKSDGSLSWSLTWSSPYVITCNKVCFGDQPVFSFLLRQKNSVQAYYTGVMVLGALLS